MRSGFPRSVSFLRPLRSALPLAAAILTLGGCDALDPGYTRVTITGMELTAIPQLQQDGSGWDAIGGADPYVVVSNRGGGALYTSLYYQDPTDANLPLPYEANVVLNDLTTPVFITVYDEDLSEDDVIASWEVVPGQLGGLLYLPTGSLNGPNGQEMLRLSLSWGR